MGNKTYRPVCATQNIPKKPKFGCNLQNPQFGYLPIPNSEWLLLQTIPSTFIISHWMIEMHTFEKEKNWISVKSMHLFFLYLLLRIFEEIIILKNIMEKWNCIYIMRLCKKNAKKKENNFLLKKIFFSKNCTFDLYFRQVCSLDKIMNHGISLPHYHDVAKKL